MGNRIGSTEGERGGKKRRGIIIYSEPGKRIGKQPKIMVVLELKKERKRNRRTVLKRGRDRARLFEYNK